MTSNTFDVNVTIKARIEATSIISEIHHPWTDVSPKLAGPSTKLVFLSRPTPVHLIYIYILWRWLREADEKTSFFFRYFDELFFRHVHGWVVYSTNENNQLTRKQDNATYQDLQCSVFRIWRHIQFHCIWRQISGTLHCISSYLT